jgi:DNA-binding PadR family transcriptional regulator
MTDTEFTLLSFCFQWRTGRKLAQMYQEETGRSIAYGTVYRVMRHLKEEGLVESRKSRDENGVFREFKITSGGSRKRHERVQAQEERPTPAPGLRPRRA